MQELLAFSPKVYWVRLISMIIPHIPKSLCAFKKGKQLLGNNFLVVFVVLFVAEVGGRGKMNALLRKGTIFIQRRAMKIPMEKAI